MLQALFGFFGNYWFFFAFFFVLWLSVFTVEQQEVAIVTRFGKFSRLAQAGLNFKIPFLESVVDTLSLRIQELDVEVDTKTKDDVTVTLTVTIFYAVIAERAQDAYYKLNDVEAQLTALVSDAVRGRVANMDLNDAFAHQDGIVDGVKVGLAETMIPFGWNIVRALVTEIVPDEKVMDAMNDIVAARREQEAARARGEAERILKVANAEAEAEAMRLQGKGIADQRTAILNGLAAAVKSLQAEIPGVTHQEVMSVILLTRYFDMLREMSESGGVNTIMLPSSPGGLGDLREQIISAITAGRTVPAAAPAAPAA